MMIPTDTLGRNYKRDHPTFIDLFCGCGGFTLGLHRSGFTCLAAVDIDQIALDTFQKNLSFITHDKILRRDIREFRPQELANHIGTDYVDLIVGGPPCQGFSSARQVDGANHGVRIKDDPRRILYRDFLRHVDFFQPRVFVMENVLGLRSAAGGKFFAAVQHEARGLGRDRGLMGYRVHSQVEDAWNLGVPQKRRRQLIVGVRADLPGYFAPRLVASTRANRQSNLGVAIGDLPVLRAGSGQDECDYNLKRRKRHLTRSGVAGRNYLYNVLEIDKSALLTNHVARPHSERDLRDFARLREGENSATAMRVRSIRFEFPYDKSSFKDRYTRQSRSAPCSTIVAHLGKDGLMFIHPTQNRSLTPREAARIQSFPDWFRFPVARTHAYRLIGNAVPPLISEAVGLAVKTYLKTSSKLMSVNPPNKSMLPRDSIEAVAQLIPFLDLSGQALRTVSNTLFKQAWCCVAYLFPGLHPDSALEHGNDTLNEAVMWSENQSWDPRLATPYFKLSGWPVALAPLADEAWRRFNLGLLREDEFYCSDAQILGLTSSAMGQISHSNTMDRM